MSSQHKYAVELCALLVNETYGDLTSRIFVILLRRGRSPLTTIRKHTQLSPQQIRHGLAVLIQQDLVYFYQDPETKVTSYEANHLAAYRLLRSGKISDLVEQRYGAAAKDVVVNLFQWGHTQVHELVRAYEKAQAPNAASQTNGVNGAHHSDKVTSTHQLHSILIQLLEAGLVEPVDSRMLTSPNDTYQLLEREILREYRDGVKGAKGKEEVASRVRERMRKIRAESAYWQPKSGKDQAINGFGTASTKKRKLAKTGLNGHHETAEDVELESDLTLRVNYEKCSVLLRNQQLVDLAKLRLGETPSLVYEQFLLYIEHAIPRCRPDPFCDDALSLPLDPIVTTTELLAQLPANFDLASGIGKISSKADSKLNGTATHARESDIQHDDDDDVDIVRPAKRQRVTFEDESNLNGEFERSRTVQLKGQLEILAADTCGFLKKVNSDNHGNWSVDYVALTGFLRTHELDKMIRENHGPNGHRLVRIMKKIGKLEEKMIPNIGLMKQSEIRTKLAEMHMAGIVDIQEISRDAQHTIARTIFLWYFDEPRVSDIYLDKVFKSMTRCFQRLECAKADAKDVLMVLERKDVKGLAPEEFLQSSSLHQLRTFEHSEDALLTQIGRLDDLVGIFQDF